MGDKSPKANDKAKSQQKADKNAKKQEADRKKAAQAPVPAAPKKK